MGFLTFLTYAAIAVALLVFLRFSTRIPLRTRLLIAIAIPLFAIILFFFISFLFAIALIILAIFLVFWLFAKKKRT